MGGSDQWGNMTTGSELIRRKCGGDAFVFTNPLITKADGGKFGKTEGGNIWLDANRTSPYQFYQFWLNASDADATKWIKIFTFLTQPEIDSLIAEHQKDAGKRVLQKRLAEEVTRFVHGEAALLEALQATAKAFAEKDKPAEDLSIEDIEALHGVTQIEYSKERIEAAVDIVSFLAETGIEKSKGEARKLVQAGGAHINRKKVEGIDLQINTSHLLHGKYILAQKGKKNHFVIKAI